MTANIAPAQDERILAALARITAILPFTGALAPIVIWVTQREKIGNRVARYLEEK